MAPVRYQQKVPYPQISITEVMLKIRNIFKKEAVKFKSKKSVNSKFMTDMTESIEKLIMILQLLKSRVNLGKILEPQISIFVIS